MFSSPATIRRLENIYREVTVEEFGNRHFTPIVVASIIVVGLIATTLVGIFGFARLRHGEGHVLDVVGSARKPVHSDLAVWTGTFSVSAPTTVDAYKMMKRCADKVRSYMASKNIGEKEMVLSAITIGVTHKTDAKGNALPAIDSYQLSQTVEVSSHDVDRVADLSRKATELINEGVDFQSNAPRYYYTHIADQKLEVLAMASRDARLRAEKIAENAGARPGTLSFAMQGVFQITAPNSTEVSDSGIYDTTTIDKEIAVIVICKFDIDR